MAAWLFPKTAIINDRSCDVFDNVGADLDIKDLFGRTALNLAISYGEAGIAITLVEAGEQSQE